VKFVIRGFSAFPGETTGFVSGYRYLENAHDLQAAIFHSSLLPPNFSLIKWVEEGVLLRLNRHGQEKSVKTGGKAGEKSENFSFGTGSCCLAYFCGSSLALSGGFGGSPRRGG
jgi:hypothetical protein